MHESFPKIGNEKDVVVDERTGREVVFLTCPDRMDTLYYPTCRSWTRDGRYMLLESDRPRPDGTSRPLERQLLAADAETGDLLWLATLEVESTSAYGPNHLRISSQYHADYCPQTHRIVYYDMTGHRLYLLDLGTGERRPLWHMTSGTIGDPPSIAEDGSRIVFYAAHPGPPETDWFTGETFTIYALDLEPASGEPRGRPYVITSYAARKGANYVENPRDRIHINHCQVNPANPDEVSYAHEYGGSPADGSRAKSRLWFTRVDGGGEGPLTPTPAGRWHTHEVWGPLGEWIYYVDGGDVARIHVASRRIEKITDGMEPRASHLTVSRDEATVVVDSFTSLGEDGDGNTVYPLVTVDVATGRSEVLAGQAGGQGHPRHPHPNLSPCGTKVGFTVAVGAKNSRAAFVRLR